MILQIATECVVCHKTLGQDSRDQGFNLCHLHRQCVVCKAELDSTQAKWSYEKFVEENEEPELEKIDFSKLEAIHSRCFILRHTENTVKVTQSEFDYLNLIRLMIEPVLDNGRIENENDAFERSRQLIQNMTYEQQQMHLSRMQACIAQVSNALALNPQKKKEAANAREREKLIRAKQESITSSRPASKSSEDSEELQLGTYMEMHGLTERKQAMEFMKRRNREAKKLMIALRISEQDALGMANKFMLEGRLHKK